MKYLQSFAIISEQKMNTHYYNHRQLWYVTFGLTRVCLQFCGVVRI